MKRRPDTEETRLRKSLSARAYWADPAVRAAHGIKTREKMARAEVRLAIRERTKAAMADPDVRARQQSGLRQAMADPAVRQKISERTKAAMAAPGVRKRISERTKKALADSVVRQRMLDRSRAGTAAKLDRDLKDIKVRLLALPRKVRLEFLEQMRIECSENSRAKCLAQLEPTPPLRVEAVDITVT